MIPPRKTSRHGHFTLKGSFLIEMQEMFIKSVNKVTWYLPRFTQYKIETNISNNVYSQTKFQAYQLHTIHRNSKSVRFKY